MTKEKIQNTAAIVIILAVVVGLFWWVFSHSPSKSVRQVIEKPLDINIPSYKITSAFNTNIEEGPALGDGAIISRPIKGLGGFKHYGVMIGNKVSHFNQYGYHLDSIGGFAEGAVVKIVKRGLVGKDLAAFKLRFDKIVKKYKGAKYDAMNNNCEHYVNEMVFGIHKSMQSELTMDMVKSYTPMLRENLAKSKVAVFLPAFDNMIKQLDSDTLKNK